jgi:hypothetical protein
MTTFIPGLQITPARVAALGAAVGGLAALAILNVAGEARVELAAVVPLWAFVVGAQAVGAAIGWAKGVNHTAQRG